MMLRIASCLFSDGVLARLDTYQLCTQQQQQHDFNLIYVNWQLGWA